MMNKKEQKLDKAMASNLYNGFTLWLTSMFAIPLIITILFGLFAYNYISWVNLDYLVLAMSVVALIPGTIYASRYLNSRYYIKDRKKVIRHACLIALLFYIAFVASQVIFFNPHPDLTFDRIFTTEEFFVSLTGFMAKIATFYLAAKHNLKQD